MKSFEHAIKSFLAICFVLLQGGNIYAQDQSVADSLVKIYQKGQHTGTVKLDLLRNLAFNEVNDLKLSLSYAEELISLSNLEGNDLYLHRGYLQKGNINRIFGNFDIALDAYFRSGEAATKAGYIEGQGAAYTAIADIYSLTGNATNAENYYDKAIQLLRKTNDSITLATVLLNTGDFYFHNKKYEAALAFFEEAGPIFKNTNYLIGTAYYLGNTGMVHARQDKVVLAEANLNEAVTILEELGVYDPVCEYLIYLSDIYLKQQDINKAISTAKRSLELAITYGMKDRISTANLQLSTLYEQLGNRAEAFKYYRNHIAYRDSVNNIKSVQQIADLRTNYEISQKQNEVDLLEKESELQDLKEKSQGNVILASIIAFTCVLIIALALLNRFIFVRKTKRIIEEEKNRSDNLLLNILPAETAMELKQKGRVQARKFESVTVLFTDFKGFTHYSKDLSPEVLVKSLDYYFSKFDRIFEKYGLEKIKTIGDSYMCSGGLHSQTKDHALKMVQAAFEVLEFVENTKKNTTTNVNFDIRIGINTGSVVAGVVGNKKFAYDIWGDTVNVASRMESMSEPGKINISHSTYELIKSYFECEYRGEIEAKNRGKIRMYFVNGIKKNAMGADKKLIKDENAL